MSSQLRVDTDQMRATIQQFRQSNQMIEDQLAQARQAMSAMQQSQWSGRHRTAAEGAWFAVNSQFAPTQATILDMAQRLQRTADAYEEAARVFGEEGVSGVGNSVVSDQSGANSGADADATQHKIDAEDVISLPDDAPKNMFDMYEKFKEEPAIKIFQVGENEYAITINGTDHLGVDNGWDSAIVSGLGGNTRYMALLAAAIRSLPNGSSVHLFGYSQGGIAAQNLASNQSMIGGKNIKINSVTTFGSPPPVHGKADGVEYNAFRVPGDVITKASLPGVCPNGESILTMNLYDLYKTVLHDAHGSYGDKDSTVAKILKDSDGEGKLPFDPDRWDRVDNGEFDAKSYMDVANEIKGAVMEGLSETVQSAVETYNNITEGAQDFANTAIDKSNQMLDSTKDNIKSVIDKGSDFANDAGAMLNDVAEKGKEKIKNFIPTPQWPFKF
ncbi:WXG100 family type VII secretion target [Candidatus Viridilinea mediisalina]|uniref:Uncharacterized protein n=1 Tax=Candidatus Viridilinea mediisalina TaxID=2024553 RepID=A0A2A6RG33_9CHLR|nr:WXG100 family type VII secretion target [Candidatus Viridilinea mediisalina]PDW01820.1 hypothetical protein CJ255_17185 [Candidatus Viridilinea mediisalina]